MMRYEDAVKVKGKRLSEMTAFGMI